MLDCSQIRLMLLKSFIKLHPPPSIVLLKKFASKHCPRNRPTATVKVDLLLSFSSDAQHST